MGEVSYGVASVVSWKFDSARSVISAMHRKSGSVKAAAESSARDYDVSGPFWDAAGGQAARNLSFMHNGDLLRSVAVINALADAAGETIRQIEGEISSLKNALMDVDASEYELSVRDDGGVYSRRSNAEWADEWGIKAAVKLPLKLAAEREFTARIRGILANVQSLDQGGGEKTRSTLERLTDAVKKGAVPRPADPRLNEILNRYQANKSHGQASLWPDGTTLRAIRAVYPGFNPRLMTPEEVVLVSEVLAQKGPVGVWNWYSAMERATNTAEQRYSGTTNDGHGDAFRHAYWNALMTKEFGEDWTKAYTTAHEGLGGNPANREAMDLYNNEVGRRVAMQHPKASAEELADLVAAEVKKGSTVVIGPDNAIDWSNHVANKKSGQPGTVGIPLPSH